MLAGGGLVWRSGDGKCRGGKFEAVEGMDEWELGVGGDVQGSSAREEPGRGGVKRLRGRVWAATPRKTM